MSSLDDAKNLFIQELKTQLVDIKATIGLEKISVESVLEARKIIHRIKGAAGFFGFTPLAKSTNELLTICKTIEGNPLLLTDINFMGKLKTELSLFITEAELLN